MVGYSACWRPFKTIFSRSRPKDGDRLILNRNEGLM